jgi:hypothetical protein
MTRVLQAVRKALRMAGVELVDLPQDPPLSAVVALLRSHGLRLVVANAEHPSLQLSARWLVRRAFERALAAGEPEHGMNARLGRLVGRNQSSVSRALSGETELDDDARAALEAHLLDPPRHPLPAAGKSTGRPKGR